MKAIEVDGKTIRVSRRGRPCGDTEAALIRIMRRAVGVAVHEASAAEPMADIFLACSGDPDWRKPRARRRQAVIAEIDRALAELPVRDRDSFTTCRDRLAEIESERT